MLRNSGCSLNCRPELPELLEWILRDVTARIPPPQRQRRECHALSAILSTRTRRNGTACPDKLRRLTGWLQDHTSAGRQIWKVFIPQSSDNCDSEISAVQVQSPPAPQNSHDSDGSSPPTWINGRPLTARETMHKPISMAHCLQEPPDAVQSYSRCVVASVKIYASPPTTREPICCVPSTGAYLPTATSTHSSASASASASYAH